MSAFMILGASYSETFMINKGVYLEKNADIMPLVIESGDLVYEMLQKRGRPA
jgi:hypothetical protein